MRAPARTGAASLGKLSVRCDHCRVSARDQKGDRMILLSHPIGNEFVREALVAFDRAGMLSEFWTTISWNSKSPLNRALPKSLRELFERRSFPESVRNRTHTAPLREAIRLFAGAAGFPSRHETGTFSIDAVFR